MRITLSRAAAISLSIAACVACSQKVETAKAPAEPAGEAVTAVGCPDVGPAPNCVSIKSKGKSYDLAAANPPVDLSKGVGVSVRGTAGAESTACGVKLTDVTVEYLGIQCAPPAPPAAETPAA